MTRRERPRRRAKRAAWATLLLALALCLPALKTESYAAAVPMPDQIRVALYVSNGKTYNVTVPTVTLSSPGGFDVGIRLPAATRSWTSAAPGAQARFSLDGYKVLLLETADAAVAALLQQALGATQDKPYIFRAAKRGKPVYQVYAGMYMTAEEANAAKQRLAANAKVASLAKGTPATVAGPLHLNAGTYPTEAEAGQQAAALGLQGLDAWVAIAEAAEKPSYQVWVGEAADAAQLNAVRTQAAQLAPGLALQPVDAAAPYLLKRDDVTAAASSAPLSHYMFNPASQKVWVAPKDGTMAVAEKSGRQYRGNFELSQSNGRLAVVNELPFEQYLVSVVGAEMSPSWPAEALKAQAVSARTFALSLGMKYGIAHVSDSSNDQVYYGIQKEDDRVTAAVTATAGEVITVAGEVVSPYFYANGGGQTGDPVEVWGQAIPYLRTTPSPDEGAQQNKPMWFNVALPSGTVGYIREDFLVENGERNKAGLPLVAVKGTGVNVRPAPYADDAGNGSLATVNQGDKLVSLGKVVESNDFAWVRGPYTADALAKELNASVANAVSGKLETLEVSKRGPSGRAVELAANGRPFPVTKPDQYRAALFGAPSTRFEIEETGRYTVRGANGQTRSLPETKGTLYALGASSAAVPVAGSTMIVMGGGGSVRALTKEPQFRLIGNGSGHGLGMSQWGARGLAEQGYDYKRILQTYYTGITITKE